MSRRSLLYRDIDQANGIGTLLQHLTILSQHKQQSHHMNFVLKKDNSVVIENGKTIKQCACNKFFYVAIDISTKDKTKEDFMSRQIKTMSRHNIQSH